MLTASQYLTTYERRKRGWESGLLKYDETLYLPVCELVDNLNKVSPDAPIQLIMNHHGFWAFQCNGIEIGRLPIIEKPI